MAFNVDIGQVLGSSNSTDHDNAEAAIVYRDMLKKTQ